MMKRLIKNFRWQLEAKNKGRGQVLRFASWGLGLDGLQAKDKTRPCLCSICAICVLQRIGN